MAKKTSDGAAYTLLNRLKESPHGVPIRDAANLLGSKNSTVIVDETVSYIRMCGYGAVIYAKDPFGKKAVKLARTEDEFEAFERDMVSKLRKLEAELAGARKAFQQGVTTAPSLFG